MKAKDLIAALQTLPPDTFVMVDGYEWGIQLPEEARLIHIDFNWSAILGDEHGLGGAFEETDDMTKPLFFYIAR